ncbi:MAG: DUF4097 family beta strand repeat-containing protein [Acidobacteriota bacterium]
MWKKAWKTLAAAAAAMLTLSLAAQQKIDEKRPAAPDGLVTVSNVSGSVTVKGWSQPEVAVSGTLGKGSERLEFEVSGDRTTIRVILPENARRVEGSDLEIRVPESSRLEVETVSAGISVSGLSGGLSLQSVSGAVSATGPAPEVDAHSVSGPVVVETDSRKVRAKSVSGEVTVRSNSAQDVQMENVSGALTFEGVLFREGSLEISTVSGRVEASLPRDLAARFSLETFSGDISSAFGTGRDLEEDGPVGKRLRFTTGSGAARVDIQTFSGDIVLTGR